MVYDEAPAAAPAASAAPAPAAPAEVPAAVPAVPGAPGCEPTLHDFVLNLLQDPSAMKAFDLDPTGCLKNAGLTDITPADVHDVIPLVTDLVPTGGLPGLGAVPGLDALPALDGLPSVPSVPSLDDLTSSIAIDGEAGADGGWATVDGSNPLGDLTFGGKAEAGTEGVQFGALGIQETPLGNLGVGSHGSAGLDGASLGGGLYSPLGNVEHGFNVGVDGAQGLYLDGGIALPDDRYVSVSTGGGLDVNQNVVPGLPTNVGDLAKGLSDPTAAASAIAGAVPALPAVPGVPQLPLSDLPLPSVGELPVDLPAVPALPVADLNNSVDTAQQAANGAVDGGQADAGSLPALGGHLPQLPDVGGLLPNLPVNLPDLPVHLPNLPVEVPQLPSLPVAGGVDAPSVVGNVVDHTGLGNVINHNPVTETVHDIVPDLHLGL
ncbi:hypothetical protein JOF56_011585 [Kibdelosporangium banguiense]|uniref:Uncharacterized protein n=1 Tax=Kibdelosporangium banguiense TaxID=1365924 RepID=A0ABS4U3F9_9PSEU|nr:IniB N-terminal domain-containing protein [Kibdelosporangium banguiense]MBP2331200.1 hypothetical protein [Kibdelosporangium banguiense]